MTEDDLKKYDCITDNHAEYIEDDLRSLATGDVNDLFEALFNAINCVNNEKAPTLAATLVRLRDMASKEFDSRAK